MQYKKLLENMSDWLWKIDKQNNYTYCSDGVSKFLGFSANELIGRTPFDFMSEEEAKRVRKIFTLHTLNREPIIEFENIYLHKDGHEVSVMIDAIPILNEEGEVVHFQGSAKDITKEKALQLKATHQKQIIEQIHDSVISTDLEGVITDWNSGSQILLEYSSDEAIGKHISLIYLDEDLESLNKNINTLIKNGENYVIARLVTKSTKRLMVDLSLSLLKDEKSNVIGMIAYAKDITQRKQAEDALEQQSRMAQMGEMISMIAHQWRQPLNAVSLTASNLKLKFDLEEFDSKSEEDFNLCRQDFSIGLDNIQEYIRTLSSTVDDFRNFYKTDKVPVSTKLEDIVSKSLKIISMSLIEESIEIVQEYNSNEKIELYENEIMQVVLTILKNAQDNFAEKKTEKPFIRIVTENKMLFIYDNGGGVPKNILDKIFDPYFSTKLEKNGTGLGLYMSKTIVEKHHKGSLKVKNIDGGACFTIEFF